MKSPDSIRQEEAGNRNNTCAREVEGAEVEELDPAAATTSALSHAIRNLRADPPGQPYGWPGFFARAIWIHVGAPRKYSCSGHEPGSGWAMGHASCWAITARMSSRSNVREAATTPAMGAAVAGGRSSESAYFLSANRNKRSVTVNMREPPGRN